MKLLFIDIDGTLTRPGENEPSPAVVEALRKTQAKGNKIFLCTGRNMGMLSPLLKYDFDGVVASAGGYVTAGDKVLFDCPMSDEERDTALKAMHDNGIFCTIESRDHTWGDERLGDFLSGGEEGNSEIERWRKALADNLGILPMSSYDGAPLYKIVYMFTEEHQLDKARELLEDRFHFVVQEVSKPKVFNGEMINRKFDKGQGVRQIAEFYGVNLEDTYGFGDSMNDLEMIETVGTSVCMENGAKALKEISDRICPSVAEDGLVKAFQDLELI